MYKTMAQRQVGNAVYSELCFTIVVGTVELLHDKLWGGGKAWIDRDISAGGGCRVYSPVPSSAPPSLLLLATHIGSAAALEEEDV
eukprot:761482-Hanusia_phi.AAC.1